MVLLTHMQTCTHAHTRTTHIAYFNCDLDEISLSETRSLKKEPDTGKRKTCWLAMLLFREKTRELVATENLKIIEE